MWLKILKSNSPYWVHLPSLSAETLIQRTQEGDLELLSGQVLLPEPLSFSGLFSFFPVPPALSTHTG